MPISLKAKKAVTKPLTITIDGEPLKLVYRPAVITFGWLRGLQSMGKNAQAEAKNDAPAQEEATDVPTADQVMIAKILDAVESCDLEYEPGALVPMTEQGLMDVPVEILTAILTGLASANQPGEAGAGQTPAPSADFSSDALS